jgi:hypothetical protein
MSRSQRLAQQLGMPYGTACNRLRKNILFSLLKKLKENTCFKCGQVIQSVDDLSIEHKLPWEGRDADLFWDIENISFSHVGCNRPHNPPSHKKYFTPEEKLVASRIHGATSMRKHYTTEKRREKKERTGW